MAKPDVIGLTGGIASGKSSVSAILRQRGVLIIDADVISRSLTAKDTPAYHAIVHYFGTACLKQDGSLNRPYLRTRIFSNQQDKEWLETLLHPLIFKACLKALATVPPDTAYVVLDIPLLIESKLAYPVDAIWVLDTKPALQKKRLQKRDKLSADAIEAILAAQTSPAIRLAKADVRIENNKTLKELEQIVINLHEQMLRKHAQ